MWLKEARKKAQAPAEKSQMDKLLQLALSLGS
jgi:hypothetical protein